MSEKWTAADDYPKYILYPVHAGKLRRQALPPPSDPTQR